jgi:hypothetical protein
MKEKRGVRGKDARCVVRFGFVVAVLVASRKSEKQRFLGCISSVLY